MVVMATSSEFGDVFAVSHLRPARKAHVRLSKVASARDTIRGFDHGMDVVGLTFGQFSLLDLIQAGLDITGPADVAISTWSAGLYDIEAARRFVSDGRIRSIRFVMDSATQKRGQASAVEIADLFGSSSIRTTRSHAKFALLTNEAWSVVITSSMNLNLNPRCEQFEMTDDPDRAAMFLAFVDALFDEVPDGRHGDEDRTLPALFSLDDVEPSLGVQVNRRIETGKASIGA
jgi:hypothetical protein